MPPLYIGLIVVAVIVILLFLRRDKPLVTPAPATTQPVASVPTLLPAPTVTVPQVTPLSSIMAKQRFTLVNSQTGKLTLRMDGGSPANGKYIIYDNCGNINYKAACEFNPVEISPGVVMLRPDGYTDVAAFVDFAADGAPLRVGKCNKDNTLCHWKLGGDGVQLVLHPVTDPSLALTAVGGNKTTPQLRPFTNTPAQLWKRGAVVNL